MVNQKKKSSRRAKKPSFTEAVTEIVAKIQSGKTMTYGEVARQAGYLGAARAVGTLMKKNRNPQVPCHRVIRSDGSIGEYSFGGTHKKIRRLRKEGVKIHGEKRVFPK